MKKQPKENCRIGTVGGQAVIEGVMMKQSRRYSVAVRTPGGKIKVQSHEYVSVGKRYPILALPLIRGVVNMVEMMIISFRTLNYSADIYASEEKNESADFAAAETEPDKTGLTDTASADSKEKKDDKKNGEGSGLGILLTAISVLLGLAMGVFLFMFLPSFVTSQLNKLFSDGLGWWKNLIEGLLKVVIFIGYLLLALLMLFSFASCTQDPGPDAGTGSAEGTGEGQTPTATDVRVYTLNGTTGFGMAKLMDDAAKGAFSTENYTFDVKTDASEVLTALVSGDVDIAALPTNAAEANRIAANWYDPSYDTDTAPTQGVDNGADTLLLTTGEGASLAYNNELFATLSDYDAPEWETLLNQITVSELLELVHFSGFFTPAIESVGKVRQADFDGPAGFNTNTLSGAWEGTEVKETWTAYPCECLLGCSWNKDLLLQMGLSMGNEASLTDINGWYAPGINLHRTNYTSRNYEYYSEDPILSGNLAANVIHGAKINGLYCYMKHFVVSESGPNGRDWNTWLPEQVLREIYLKPFEIAVKEGGSNAVMSSFNNLGSIWTGSNHALLVDILRGEWGFRGTVITDWSDGGNPGAMNPRQGVRAGNDIWLNPNAPNINGALNASDATDVACARNSAHNVLYTLVDTIHYYNTFDRESLDTIFNANVGVKTREEPFAWWIILLVLIDVIVVAGMAVWLFFLFKPKKKAQEA